MKRKRKVEVMIKYDDDTICRLAESAEKWTAYSRGDCSIKVGTQDDCLLCVKFALSVGVRASAMCRECPVYDATQKAGCAGSPYYDWAASCGDDEELDLRLAGEEAKFLRELLFEIVDGEGGRQDENV